MGQPWVASVVLEKCAGAGVRTSFWRTIDLVTNSILFSLAFHNQGTVEKGVVFFTSTQSRFASFF